jgi:hypothetical protein
MSTNNAQKKFVSHKRGLSLYYIVMCAFILEIFFLCALKAYPLFVHLMNSIEKMPKHGGKETCTEIIAKYKTL